jgi:hypothetical protein
MLHTVAESSDDAGSVRSQDARLGHGRQAFPDPDVEMVETRGAKLDHRLSRTGLRIRDDFVPEDFGPPILVNANGVHEAESSHDRR